MIVMHRHLLVILLCLLIVRPVWAAAPPGDSAAMLCEAAVSSAEYAAGLPPRLLGAIAAVESGRVAPGSAVVRPWPWTINAGGVGQFFATKAQAVAAVRSLQAQGVRSIDVGCLQVNLMFHPTAFASLEAAFDPPTNARYAARFLQALYADRRDWAFAIGAYHSQTPPLGAAYRGLVLARWERPSLARSVLAHSAYRDFASPQVSYAAFASPDRVYAAFAPGR
jgi:hypothetical protein